MARITKSQEPEATAPGNPGETPGTPGDAPKALRSGPGGNRRQKRCVNQKTLKFSDAEWIWLHELAARDGQTPARYLKLLLGDAAVKAGLV